MIADLEVALALYSRLLEHVVVGVACFDRELALVYPAGASHGLPVEALVEVAQRVVASGNPEHDAVLEGLGLTATCVALRSGGNILGAVCTLENAKWTAESRELVTLADDAIAVFDAEHHVVFSNIAWNAVMAGELPARTRSMLSRALAGERVDFDDLVVGEHVLHGIARRFTNALGTITGVAVACRHSSGKALAATRTRDRAALAEAQLANRQKDQFIATVSHELRAPLAAMLLWEKVLRDDVLDPATRSRALDAIHESATAQSRLVADLLDISRAIAGKLHVDRHPIVIEDAILAVLVAARPLAEAKRVELVSHLDDSQHVVIGDDSRLRQVFTNLVTNAITNTDAGGRIVVSRHLRDATIEVAIEDTGHGISPDVLPHLFEPFRQGDDTGAGALGLGLTIASQLVGLHRGTLAAASPGIGHGATFTVELPLATDRPAATPVRSRQQLGGVRILLVDDDPRVLEALQLLLERAGAVVEIARSADAGVGALERSVPDVVVSDLAMPDGDGCSMMRRIRAREVGMRRVPAVAMTAHVAAVNRRDAMAAGFDRYLTKPLDVDHLISTIAGLVNVR